MPSAAALTSFNTREEALAFLRGRQSGLRACSDAMDQTLDKLHEACAERDAALEQVKAEFVTEMRSLHRQLMEAKRELQTLRAVYDFSQSGVGRNGDEVLN